MIILKSRNARRKQAPRTRALSIRFVVIIGVSLAGIGLITTLLVHRTYSYSLPLSPPLSSSSPLSWLESLLIFTADSVDKEIEWAPVSKDTITPGALLPLSGVWSSSGKSIKTALQIAVDDVIANFSQSRSPAKLANSIA